MRQTVSQSQLNNHIDHISKIRWFRPCVSDKGHVYLPACLGKEEPAYPTSLYQTPLFAVSDSGVEAEFSKEDRHQAFSQFQHWCGFE